MQKITKDFIVKNRLILFIMAAALLGLWASFALMVDQVNLLSNKQLFVECNINPLFSCTKVMNTVYANFFGIPNPIWGLIGYTSIVTFAGLMLNDKRHHKFFMYASLAFAFFAYVFSYVLIGIGMLFIGALCPLCLVSAFSATNVFAGLLYMNVKQGNLPSLFTKSKLAQNIFSRKYYPFIVIGWFVLVFIVIYIKYPTILVF